MKNRYAYRHQTQPGYPKQPFTNKAAMGAWLAQEYDMDCLLCGRRMKRVGGTHMRAVHYITEDEFREQFNINFTAGLACVQSRTANADAIKVREHDALDGKRFAKDKPQPHAAKDRRKAIWIGSRKVLNEKADGTR